MMEPKLIKVDSKQNKILIIVSLLIITLFIGTSYSLLSSNDVLTKDNSEEAIVFKTGDLNLELTGDSTLLLDKEYPKSDEEGKENKAIKLTFTNTGTIDICRYEVKLVSDNESTLDSKYLKYIVSENNEGDYKEAKNLDDTNIVYIGNKLKVNKSKTIYIKVWIDESAKDAGLSKTYSGSFEVDLYQGGCGTGEIGTEVVKETITAYAESSKDTFTGGLVAINTDGNLYNETDSKQTIREYRYSGLNVNNYVTFNDEVWRIIGVFKDEEGAEHLKIVRNSKLEANLFPETYTLDGILYNIKAVDAGNLIYWNYITTTDYSDWNKAGLQYYLNTEKDDNGANGYLHFLSVNAKNMINDTKYYLGNVNTKPLNNIIVDNTIQAYNNERGNKTCSISCIGGDVWDDRSSEWTGKIALLYPSDLGYSAKYNYWTDTKLGKYNELAWSTSWLKEIFKEWQWLLSPSTFMKNIGSDWAPTGYLWSSNGESNRNFVQPTLYLKSNVKIVSGTGEKNSPFEITL